MCEGTVSMRRALGLQVLLHTLVCRLPPPLLLHPLLLKQHPD